MPDDISDIATFYGAALHEESRLTRHQLERDMTLRYFEQYLPPGASVLEIGAATGAYTLWLARRGHRVTAVDLARPLLDRCRQQILEAGLGERVDCHVADARDLSALPPRDYDAVLLMGPLYHLVLREDRLAALRQCCQRLRPGGVLFSALISRYGIAGELLRKIPQWIEETEAVRSVMDRGHRPDDQPRGGFRGYYATLEEIGPLHVEAGLETIVLAGVEPAISADDESYNRLEGRHRELWRDLLFELSREPSMVAGSRHLLYIGRKPLSQITACPAARQVPRCADLSVRRFALADEAAVIELWRVCDLLRPWNDPHRDIATKLAHSPELLLVGQTEGRVVASIMAGYEGHRGWINYLAVHPRFQRRGIARQMMAAAEERLRALGCRKINLQVRNDNGKVFAFYRTIGFKDDQVVGLGKRLE